MNRNGRMPQMDADETQIEMKTIFSWLTVLVASACLARAEVPAGWSSNLVATLADKSQESKPVLLFFTASWCGPCRMMVRTTLTNEAVTKALEGFRHVAIDIDEHADIAAQHEIHVVPTFEILSAKGETIVQTSGYQGPEDFVNWLSNSVAQVQETQRRREQFTEKLGQVDQQLANGTAEGKRQAAADLFAMCAERDETLAAGAVARLKTLAEREPAMVLEGLNDPRLAARIYAANILRAKLGDAFDADPWSDAVMRAKAVETWRAKLATR